MIFADILKWIAIPFVLSTVYFGVRKGENNYYETDSSWLLDLTADVLRGNTELDKFDGGVSDSGEGRWTVHAAVDLGVPTPVISTALFERFESRRLGAFANKVLNGMRYMFGGHHVR